MKKKNRLLRPLWALTMLVGMGLSNQAFAATVTASGTGAWGAITWSPAAPANGDDLIIPDGAGITLGANMPINPRTITLTGNGYLDASGGGYTVTVAQAADGGIYLNGTGALTMGNGALTIGSTSYRGDLVVASTGTVNLTGTPTTISGVITNAGGGTITTTATTPLTLDGTTNCVLPAGIKNLSSLTVNKTGASVTLSDDLTVPTLNMTAGTLVVGNNDLTVATVTNVNSGATLDASATIVKNRTFGTAIAINGTGVLNASGKSNNTFSGAITLANTIAGSTLNIANSTTTISTAPAATAFAATLNANGASLTYSGVAPWSFTNITMLTDQHTDLTMIGTAAVTLPSISDLNNLTIGAAGSDVNLASNLTLNGDLTLNDFAYTFSTAGKNLTVNGKYDNKGTTGATHSVLNMVAGTLTLNGPVAAWGFDETSTNVSAGSLVIGGSGTIAQYPNPTAGVTIGALTMNRPNVTLDFDLLDQAFLITNALAVTNGTVKFADAQNATVSGTTSIGSNGKLITNAATLTTFAQVVSGTGTIDASNAADALTFTALPTFTGTLLTGSGTILTYTAGASLPESVKDVGAINVAGANAVTFNSDVKISGAIAAANLPTGAKYIVNGNTLTLGSTLISGAGVATLGTIDLKNNSSLIVTGAATFTSATTGIATDETSNLSFAGAVTDFPISVTKVKNLTLTGGVGLAMTHDLELYGNLSSSASTPGFTTGANKLIVNGDVSGVTAAAINFSGGTVTLKGQMNSSNATAITTNNATNLVIAGSGDQFVMPSAVSALASLTLNRASGMRLNGNLAVGDANAATIDLTLTNGDLDLNGNRVTLATATTKMTEAAGATVINTGAIDVTNSLGCIITQSTTDVNIEASGIGLIKATTVDNLTVRRYPTIVPIAGVGLSASRVYQITSSGAMPNPLTLEYDNSEVASNPAGLKLYTSLSTVGLPFTTFTEQTKADGSNRTVNQNTPTGKGNVAYSNFATNPGSGDFFALASTPGSGGILYTAAKSGEWTNSAVWSPNGVPTKLDQVYVGPYTVTLKGNGSDVYCQSLVLNHNSAKITPFDNTTNGDNVTINVMGNLQVTNGGSIDAINNYGRINVTIGDGVTAGVSSTIVAPASYVEGNGLSVNNLTLNGASATLNNAAYSMRIYGDMKFLGNSAFSALGNVEFYGGSNSTQNINVPSSASLDLTNLTVTNSAALATSSNMIVRGKIQTNPNSTFIADGGTVTFPMQTQDLWSVQNGSTLRLFNVEIGEATTSGATDLKPTGNIEIAGNFTKFGANTFATTNAHTITFKNTNQKELVASGTAPKFYNVVVAPNSSVKTSSSFDVYGDIDVQQNASLVADNGTITMAGGATPSYIKNVSDHTLNFFNLIVSDKVLTSDNWKISGKLDVSGVGNYLVADKGVITFENVAEKTINNTTTSNTGLTFFGVKVADGSKVKTDVANGNFTIKNNASNLDGAGLFVEGNGQFVVPTQNTVTSFEAGAGVTAGHPKTISKSANGVLKLGVLNINASANNELTTASDFEIQGATTAFSNLGAGGKFVASAGTIKFTGATPIIASVSPAVTTFNSILTEGSTDLKIADNNEFNINGDITVNGTSQINPVTPWAAGYGKINLTGSSDQVIGGTSTIPNAVEIGKLVINKANNSQVLLNTDVEITTDATAAHVRELVLTNGILNLGSKKLTVGANVISRLNGAINGANGTYIVNTDHKTPLLEDAYFTVNGEPTLNNLTVSALHVTANDLTVNGTLNLNANVLTIASGSSASAAKQLILNGNLSRATGTIDCGAASTSRLVLQGNGVVVGGLQNNFFTTVPSITVARQEALGGDLTMVSDLMINSGVKYLDLGIRKLTVGSSVTRISGSITAGVNSTVDFQGLKVPANLFTNNQVGNFISSANPLVLEGDLAIMTNLNLSAVGADISTGDNAVTFGPNMTFSNPMGSANYVMGNLIRTINANGVTDFPIGLDGLASTYKPVSMRLATPGNTQLVKVSSKEVDPTIGRGGNAKNAVNVTWNIAPQGTVSNDSVLVKFQYQYSSSLEQTLPVTNGAFPAKWNGNSWTDYRNRLATFTVADPRVITMSGYPVSLADAKGDWGVFTVDANTNAAKDKAIAVDANRVVITKIDPSNVIENRAFKVTVQLQDKNGQPITATSPFSVRLETEKGTALASTPADAIIPAGSSMTTVTGLVMATASKENQLRADTLGGSGNWQPTLSNPFSVLQDVPATQSSLIVFSNVKATSMSIDWTNAAGDKQVVLAKAESLLEDSEFPVNTTTYVANANFGSGSSIGNATVLYKGTGTSLNVTGLSPNTTYYFYVLKYSGSEGYENYKKDAATKNPNSQKTTGSTDDDVAFGSNNTRETSKAIGTNTPVTGTINSATDEDWFNFSVTNATPNVRAQLSGLPNNYNIELYDASGRRIRRGIRANNGAEGPVVNNLPAGTYTIRVYSADGSNSATGTYTLKVATKSSEIFSVTP